MNKNRLIIFVLGAPLLFVSFLVVKTFRDNKPSPRLVHRSYLEIPVESLDPLHATSTDAQLIINNAFDGLVTWDPSIGIRPQLATRWEILDGGRRYRFHLAEKAIFHDGKPVDAPAVASSLRRLNSVPSYFRDHFTNIKSVSAIGTNKVDIELHRPTPSILFLLSGVAAKVVRQTGKSFVGVGPYIPTLESHETVLDADPQYYGEKPPTPHLVFAISSQTTAIERARSGLLDDVAFIPLDGNEIDRRDGKWIVQPMWATWIIGFDQRVKPFQDARVRHELARRLRSTDFVERVYPGQEPAAGIIPWGLPGHLDPATFQTLAEGDIPGAPPTPQRIEIWIPDNIKKRARIEEWIKTSTLRSPLQVTAKPVPFDSMIRDYAKGRYGAFLLSINAEYPDPGFLLRALRSTSLSNFLGIKDLELDRALDRLSDDFSPEGRQKLMRDVNLKLLQQTASINLMHVRHRAWMRDCVTGFETNPVSEGYFNLRKVENRCRE